MFSVMSALNVAIIPENRAKKSDNLTFFAICLFDKLQWISPMLAGRIVVVHESFAKNLESCRS